MSASTGTIQRPVAQGSILGAIAVGVATLFAVGALAWGAVNLTATKSSATPAAAPMPYSPAQAQQYLQYRSTGSIVGKPGNVTPRFDTQVSGGSTGSLVGKPGNVTPRFDTQVSGGSTGSLVGKPGNVTPRLDSSATIGVSERGK